MLRLVRICNVIEDKERVWKSMGQEGGPIDEDDGYLMEILEGERDTIIIFMRCNVLWLWPAAPAGQFLSIKALAERR